jgi:Spectrin repeat.
LVINERQINGQKLVTCNKYKISISYYQPNQSSPSPQVQVLREEFRTQQPQLHHLTSKGESVLARIGDPSSPDSKNIEAKLKSILEKWADLLGKLDERAASLGAAADTAREFDAALTRLKDNLQNISDQLDDIPLDKEPEEQLRKLQVSRIIGLAIIVISWLFC